MKPAPTPTALSRWDGWSYVLPLFLASRLLLYAAAVLLPYLLSPQVFSAGLPHGTLCSEYWSRWDANWYSIIANDGYSFRPDAPSSVAFFPLHPLLMRILTWCGMPGWGAGMAVANLCTLLLLLVFYRWMRREFDRPGIAESATALLAFCPQSCWFILGYSEPLYLLTAVAALSEARRQRWATACLWALAHGLTRSNGITLALPLLFIAAPTLLDAIKARAFRATLCPSLAVVGSWIGHVSYLVFLQFQFGTWQANQITSKAGWDVSLAIDRVHLLQKIPGYGFHLFEAGGTRTEWIAWSWLLALFFTLFAAIVFREKRQPWFWIAALAAFWSLFLLTAENDGLTGSMGRFAAALFPVPVALALFAEERRWAQPVFLAFNAGTAVLHIALVFAGYHIV